MIVIEQAAACVINMFHHWEKPFWWGWCGRNCQVAVSKLPYYWVSLVKAEVVLARAEPSSTNVHAVLPGGECCLHRQNIGIAGRGRLLGGKERVKSSVIIVKGGLLRLQKKKFKKINKIFKFNSCFPVLCPPKPPNTLAILAYPVLNTLESQYSGYWVTQVLNPICSKFANIES